MNTSTTLRELREFYDGFLGKSDDPQAPQFLALIDSLERAALSVCDSLTVEEKPNA